ncbi:MAG: LPD38 domain-containing protein, partial [Vicinamibacterales bacterium]
LKDSMLAAAAEPFTRLLRAGATLTPEFIVRNPGRDTLVAFLQSRYGFIPGVDTVRGLLGLILNDADAKLYFTSGIDQAALVGQDRNRVRQERDKLTREGHAQLAKYFVRNPLELLRALSSQMENATRLGEFKLALEAGGVERGVLKRLFGPSDRVVTEEALTRATLAARDVTTDFSRGGDWSREANRYSAFFNARVQGYVRLGETVARDPIGTLEHVAGLATLSALLWFWNNDDDEYQELPEWERRTYWHIKIPGAAYFIRVPKPFEWGYLPDLVEGALEWSKTRDASAWRVVKPADGAMVQTLVSLMPTAILPMLEAYTNYSTFRERNIVSTWDLNLPAEDQYSDFTSETAKGLGKLIGVSPAKLDHIIYGYTAGLGRQAVSTADDALGALGILPKKSEKPARLFDEIPVVGKVPVVGAVAGNVARVFAREHNFTGSSVSIADFYDAYDEMTGVERSIRRKLANNETAAAKALADAHRDEWGAFERDGRAMHFTGRQAALLREGRKAMTDLGDEIDLIFKAPADKMDPQQKRAAQNLVRAKMVDIARKALGRPGLAQFQAPPR